MKCVYDVVLLTIVIEMMFITSLFALTTLLVDPDTPNNTGSHMSDSLHDYCDGEWINRSSNFTMNEEYLIFRSRTIFDTNHIEESVQEFVKNACPAQAAMYTCYYGVDEADRASMLENRHFIPNHPQRCQSYTPTKFLQLIRNRKVVMLGDSVIGQIWQSLVFSI
jgi:hypothetical protein